MATTGKLWKERMREGVDETGKLQKDQIQQNMRDGIDTTGKGGE